jgi:hypothetical protein
MGVCGCGIKCVCKCVCPLLNMHAVHAGVQVQDRVHFLINNLSEDTLVARASEIKSKASPGVLLERVLMCGCPYVRVHSSALPCQVQVLSPYLIAFLLILSRFFTSV